METLERESPDIITLEMSEYGVAFRERNGFRLKERLFSIIQGLHEKSAHKEKEKHDKSHNPFEIGPIRAILLTLELPFEFTAVKTYCERKRIPFRCIDLSKYSRMKLKTLQKEMITEDNVKKILTFAALDPHEQLPQQRNLARMLTSHDADQLFIKTFLNGKSRDGIVNRDRYMSLRIREILKNNQKTLHVGGWEHLLDAPGGKTLYGLLKSLRPQRILSL
jgi:cellobiose-specific phosphotransferase system component IIB